MINPTKLFILIAVLANVMAEVCDPGLQTGFDECLRNTLQATDPAAACTNQQDNQSKWYSCLCDKSAAFVGCYENYCTVGAGFDGAKRQRDAYCAAFAQLNPQPTSLPAPAATNVPPQSGTSAATVPAASNSPNVAANDAASTNPLDILKFGFIATFLSLWIL